MLDGLQRCNAARRRREIFAPRPTPLPPFRSFACVRKQNSSLEPRSSETERMRARRACGARLKTTESALGSLSSPFSVRPMRNGHAHGHHAASPPGRPGAQAGGAPRLGTASRSKVGTSPPREGQECAHNSATGPVSMRFPTRRRSRCRCHFRCSRMRRAQAAHRHRRRPSP